MSDRPSSKFKAVLAAGTAVVALATSGCATYDNRSNDRESASRTYAGPNGGGYTTYDRKTGATNGIDVNARTTTVTLGTNRTNGVKIGLDTKKTVDALGGLLGGIFGGGQAQQPQAGGTTPTPLTEPTGAAPTTTTVKPAQAPASAPAAKKPQPQF